jgi:hypothetical protein
MDAFGILLQIIKGVNRLKFNNPDSSQIPFEHLKLQPTSKGSEKNYNKYFDLLKGPGAKQEVPNLTGEMKQVYRQILKKQWQLGININRQKNNNFVKRNRACIKKNNYT